MSPVDDSQFEQDWQEQDWQTEDRQAAKPGGEFGAEARFVSL